MSDNTSNDKFRNWMKEHRGTVNVILKELLMAGKKKNRALKVLVRSAEDVVPVQRSLSSIVSSPASKSVASQRSASDGPHGVPAPPSLRAALAKKSTEAAQAPAPPAPPAPTSASSQKTVPSPRSLSERMS